MRVLGMVSVISIDVHGYLGTASTYTMYVPYIICMQWRIDIDGKID